MEEKQPTVVICDDDPLMRSVLKHMLADCGITLLGEADTAIRAIDLVERVKPDVVIVDVAMPGMSGLEAVPVLRRVAPECQVVICSAFEVSQHAADEAGTVAVVDKTRLVELEALLKGLARPEATSTH